MEQIKQIIATRLAAARALIANSTYAGFSPPVVSPAPVIEPTPEVSP